MDDADEASITTEQSPTDQPVKKGKLECSNELSENFAPEMENNHEVKPTNGDVHAIDGKTSPVLEPPNGKVNDEIDCAPKAFQEGITSCIEESSNGLKSCIEAPESNIINEDTHATNGNHDQSPPNADIKSEADDWEPTVKNENDIHPETSTTAPTSEWDTPAIESKPVETPEAPNVKASTESEWDTPDPKTTANKESEWDPPETIKSEPAVAASEWDAPAPAPTKPKPTESEWDTPASKTEPAASDWDAPAPSPKPKPATDDWDTPKTKSLEDDWGPPPKPPGPKSKPVSDWDTPAANSKAAVSDWDTPTPASKPQASVSDWDTPAAASSDWDAPAPASKPKAPASDWDTPASSDWDSPAPASKPKPAANDWDTSAASSWDAPATASSGGGDAWGTSNDGWGSTSSSGWGSGGGSGRGFSSGGGGGAGRGRGRGRGGDSSGGGRGCHKCGEEGHFARECTKAGSGGGGGGRGCHKCREEGHFARECPKGGGGGGRACHKCGEEGHMARECTKPGSGGGGRTCHKCGEPGHMARECTKSGGGSFNRNNNSGGGGGGDWGTSGSSDWGTGGSDWGTGSSSKPAVKASSGDTDWGTSTNDWGTDSGTTNKTSKGDDWGTDSGSKATNDDWGSGGGGWGDSGGGGGGSSSASRGGGGKGCHKCGEEGHFARECPKAGSGGGGGGRGCHNCGEEGHMARECPKESVGPDGKPRAPLYKPPELSENDEGLYETIAVGDNFKRYETIPCKVSGNPPLPPPECYTTFEEVIESETILTGLRMSRIDKPTPIQKYGMRIVFAGRDLMACAQTGSGKTLAFVLPILQTLFKEKDLPDGYGQPVQHPYAVIVTPTRELTIQIHKEAYKYSKGSIVKVQCIYGGTSTGYQRSQLSKGCHILVGTPGRLLDFLDKGYYDLSSLKYFVLDEADRMIDQGFIPEVRRMVANPTMPKKKVRQTLMFSATFQDEVQRTAAEFLADDYLFLTVGVVGAANSDVDQTILRVEKFEKRNKLLEVLGDASSCKDRIMIFVESKKTADFLASFLSQSNYKATSIHGDRYQHQREEALKDLKSGKFPVLVATSVASRGLDIKDVRHVINYDLPKEIDDYIHRIGRTGRVGNKGKATSFYDPNQDKNLATDLRNVMKDASMAVPDWLEDEARGGSSNFVGGNDFGGLDIRGSSGGYIDYDQPRESPAATALADDGW